MRGVRQKLSRPAVVLSGLALALSTLCAPAARAGLFDDEEARKAYYFRLLDSLKDAKDPWETSREEQPIKQFIPIKLEA